MNKKTARTVPWWPMFLLPQIPIVAFYSCLWYHVLRGDDVNIYTVVIPAAAAVLVAIISGVFAYRTNLKLKSQQDILDALGTKGNGSIMNAIGVTGNGSIMNALGVTGKGIMDGLGIDKDRPSISAQLGVTGDNLTTQHKTIENKVDNINDRAEAADRRNAILSGDLKTIADAVEALNAFKDKMERLYSENIDLRSELDKADEKIVELSKDRIPFDSGLASAKQDEQEKEPGRSPRGVSDDEETEM